MQTLWDVLVRTSSGWRWRLLLAIMAGCTIGFVLRGRLLETDLKSPDSRIVGYSGVEVAEFLDQIGPQGRLLYGVTQLSLDLLYPLAYATLIGVGMTKFCDPKSARLLLWLPIIALAADCVENSLTAFLALSDTLTPSPLALGASIATRIKWLSLALSVVALILSPLLRKK